jgi:hypothetical protein
MEATRGNDRRWTLATAINRIASGDPMIKAASISLYATIGPGIEHQSR